MMLENYLLPLSVILSVVEESYRKNLKGQKQFICFCLFFVLREGALFWIDAIRLGKEGPGGKQWR